MNRRVLLTSMATLALASGILIAAPIIDQEQVNTNISSTLAVGGASQQKLAQVVTAGRTGRLTDVTIPIMCQPGAKVLVSIQKTAGGVPTGSVLAQTVLPGTQFPTLFASPAVGFRIVRFDTPATVSTGQVYAIVLEAFGDSCGVFGGPAGDSYSAGTAYYDARPNPPGWLAMSPVSDLAFQTFVE
jgi:hypothetical protein